MATLQALADLPQSHATEFSDLVDKIAVAVQIKAVAIAALVTPTPNQVAWALAALDNPRGEAVKIARYVIAKNESATIVQIVGAADTTIQSNVNEAVDNLASL